MIIIIPNNIHHVSCVFFIMLNKANMILYFVYRYKPVSVFVKGKLVRPSSDFLSCSGHVQ